MGVLLSCCCCHGMVQCEIFSIEFYPIILFKEVKIRLTDKNVLFSTNTQQIMMSTKFTSFSLHSEDVLCAWMRVFHIFKNLRNVLLISFFKIISQFSRNFLENYSFNEIQMCSTHRKRDYRELDSFCHWHKTQSEKKRNKKIESI